MLVYLVIAKLIAGTSIHPPSSMVVTECSHSGIVANRENIPTLTIEKEQAHIVAKGNHAIRQLFHTPVLRSSLILHRGEITED